jgi:Phage XkdN-like protein.
MDKVKLSDLIAQAEKKKTQSKQRKQLYIKSLDGVITVQHPDRALCLEVQDMGSDGNAYLIYECVIEPNLKDSALQNAYGCIKPLDIVDAIFEPGEIALLSNEIIKMAGYDESAVKVVEDLKN